MSGAVWKRSDGALTWSAVGTLTVGALHMLAAHPTKAGLVYAATNVGVFRTTDGGTTWQPFNVGLTNINVLSVVFDLANPTIVYVGTAGGGVFKATP